MKLEQSASPWQAVTWAAQLSCWHRPMQVLSLIAHLTGAVAMSLAAVSFGAAVSLLVAVSVLLSVSPEETVSAVVAPLQTATPATTWQVVLVAQVVETYLLVAVLQLSVALASAEHTVTEAAVQALPSAGAPGAAAAPAPTA